MKSKIYTERHHSQQSASIGEDGNPAEYWIPGQARNDKKKKTNAVVYKSPQRNL